jgi:hypothetical protein
MANRNDAPYLIPANVKIDMSNVPINSAGEYLHAPTHSYCDKTAFGYKNDSAGINIPSDIDGGLLFQHDDAFELTGSYNLGTFQDMEFDIKSYLAAINS